MLFANPLDTLALTPYWARASALWCLLLLLLMMGRVWGSTRVGSDSTSRRATQPWNLKARPIHRDGSSLRFGMDSSSTCLGSSGLGIWRLDPSLFLFERTTVINTFCFLVSLHTTTIKLKDITIIMESKYMHWGIAQSGVISCKYLYRKLERK